MSNNEIVSVASQIRTLRSTVKDLNDKLTVLENQLKGAFDEDIDIMMGGYHIIIKTVESTRLNSKALRIDLGDEVLDPYLSTVMSRRLTVN